MIEFPIQLEEGAQFPTQGYEDDAGWDLYAHKVLEQSVSRLVYSTGVRMAIPKGYVGFLIPRSSIRNTGLRLTNSVGVIDSGYTNVIQVTFDRDPLIQECVKLGVCADGPMGFEYKEGDRIAQIVFIKKANIKPVLGVMPKTERGERGHGSTGR